jgi:prolyl oligopeptidase
MFVSAATIQPNRSLKLPDGRSQSYPQAPTSDQVDTVNGIEVADPFRPLENITGTQTKIWVEEQNQLTRDYLAAIPERDSFEEALRGIQAKIRRLEDVQGDKIYYTMGVGKQHAAIFESKVDGSNEKMLYDPNQLSQAGNLAVDEWKISPDGTRLALGVRLNGTDAIEWRVHDLNSDKTLPERISNSRYGADSLSWSQDSKGFFYHRYKQPEAGQELTEVVQYENEYYHSLGTPQSEDKKNDAEGVPQSGPWTYREVEGNDWTRAGDEGGLTYVMAKGPMYPKGAILSWDDEDEREKVLVPNGDNTLTQVVLAHGELVAQYLEDAHSKLVRYDKQGQKLGEIPLPGMGSVTGLEAGPEGKVIYSYSSPTQPHTIYSFDTQTGQNTVVWKPEINYNMDNYVTRLTFCESKDGTRVPVYLTHHKDTPMDGQRPTYMYAYGGFDANETPRFDWTQLPWFDQGGVYASAVLRGGGEYGAAWHKDGMRMRKQNVFDDFIAAGEGLIRQGVTAPQHLGIGGASNGGLLVAATELQRPDLFGAALPQVGVHDMVRFPEYTGGHHWIREYGEKDKPNTLKNMLKYSPVHNVKDGVKYPPTMVMTGDHDDRVVPSHSYKLAAEMQQSAPEDGNPVLLRTAHNIGHGFGMPRDMRIEEQADQWAFLWHHLAPDSAQAS